METLGRDDIMPEARAYLAVKCLTKRPKRVPQVLAAVNDLLFDKTPDTGERLTSFEQDAPLIRSAFRQVYGINLHTAKLHWIEFIELLHNLPEGNRYEEVLGIRARPMPAPTKYNQKEREWLLKAKQQFALHLTEKEAKKKYDHDVERVFDCLLSMIPKEVKNNGE